MIKELFSLNNNYYYNPFAVPVLLSSLAILSLGLLGFSKNPRQLKNQSFFYTCFTISGWLFFASLNYFSKNAAVALFWYKYFAYNFVLIISPTLYFMDIVHADQLNQKYKKLTCFFFGLLTFVIILNLHPALILTGIKSHFYGYYVSFDKLGIITIFFWLIPVIFATIQMANFYRNESSPIKKKHLKIFLIGHIIAYTAVLDFLPAIFVNRELYPLGYISFMFFVVTLYYAMARYRLMEIDTVLHKTLLWIITILSLIIPASLIISLFFGRFAAMSLFFKLFILALILFCFLTYYNYFKPKIDHLFRRRKYDYQSILSEIPSRIGAELELNSFINRLFKELREVLYIQNGLLLVKLPQDNYYRQAGSIGYDKLKERGIIRTKAAELTPGSSIIKWLTEHKKALEKERIEADPQYSPIKAEARELFQELSLEVLVPVLLKDGLKGLLVLGKKENLQGYRRKDIQLLEQLGCSLGVTLDNVLHHQDIVEKERLSEELKLGREMQIGLIPKEVPDIKGLNIAGFMETAKEIGGDYYDFIPFNDNEIGIIVGDVSGKGVAAGLLMGMAKTAIHLLSHEYDSPRQILNRTNQLLYQYTCGEKFMSMLYLRWKGESKQVKYSSAGHEHIIIYRNGPQGAPPHGQDKSNLEIIKSGGFVLGMVPEVDEFLEEKILTLHSQDKVILYTDGVTDARNDQGQMFGLQKLLRIVEEYGYKAPQELIDLIKKELYNFMGKTELYDDITLVVMEAR